ncbi:putative Ca2+-dependent phospholipid-binding protein [Handroanthus impetiginosus]|uniref:Putative Ca2+-dependent phospholipid-binding protein n=1 Tax=Handroanthus impetiginosus TaxID=429701 RepID=A0A2G9G8M4_9LAMI|nr:putative Ca2+-dependent phospholipid-binding protein [Handroanthus impetiginosus]
MATGIMEVTVVGARDLKSTEFFGKIDPYVVIEYKNQEQRSANGRPKSSKCLLKCCFCLPGQGSNPEWNEKFKFNVEYKPGADEQHKLILKIMDHDTFTDDDYLGQATIYLKDLFEEGLENGKAELRTQKYRVVSSNKTYHGEIQVGITFAANGETDQQECGGLKENKE